MLYRAQDMRERTDCHCLMVSHQIDHIRPPGHIQHDLESIGASVDHIPQDVECIIRTEVDLFQELPVLIQHP